MYMWETAECKSFPLPRGPEAPGQLKACGGEKPRSRARRPLLYDLRASLAPAWLGRMGAAMRVPPVCSSFADVFQIFLE